MFDSSHTIAIALSEGWYPSRETEDILLHSRVSLSSFERYMQFYVHKTEIPIKTNQDIKRALKYRSVHITERLALLSCGRIMAVLVHHCRPSVDTMIWEIASSQKRSCATYDIIFFFLGGGGIFQLILI